MTIVNMCQVRDENTDYLTRHHAHCAIEQKNRNFAEEIHSKTIDVVEHPDLITV